MLNRDSLILILFILIVIIYLYQNYLERFETDELNNSDSNNSANNSSGNSNSNVEKEELPTIKLEDIHADEKKIIKRDVKFITSDGYYLDFFKLPLTDILRLLVTKLDKETTKFVLNGSYIMDTQGNYIKIHTSDNSKFKLSPDLLLEPDTSSFISQAFWSPLLYNDITNNIYFESNVSSSDKYTKCYLDVFDANINPTLTWHFCDPVSPPILSTQSTRFYIR